MIPWVKLPHDQLTKKFLLLLEGVQYVHVGNKCSASKKDILLGIQNVQVPQLSRIVVPGNKCEYPCTEVIIDRSLPVGGKVQNGYLWIFTHLADPDENILDNVDVRGCCLPELTGAWTAFSTGGPDVFSVPLTLFFGYETA